MKKTNRPTTILSPTEFPSPGRRRGQTSPTPFGFGGRPPKRSRFGLSRVGMLPFTLSLFLLRQLIGSIASAAMPSLIVLALVWWFASPYLSILGDPLAGLADSDPNAWLSWAKSIVEPFWRG